MTNVKSDDHREKPFDLLAELGRYGSEKKIPLTHPQIMPQFLTFVKDALEKALKNPSLLYGTVTESMFEAMVISLGELSLLKAEDSGRAHPEGCFKIPDFRIVLRNGEQWLVEVKNIHTQSTDPSKRERLIIKQGYRDKLEKYASATGGQLKLAVFWAKWRLWTLVSPEKLVDADGKLILDMQTALEENELVRLGDRMIGTRPPLRICFMADPTKPTQIAADGTAHFTIAKVRTFSEDAELFDPIEKQIVWMFALYGQWQESGPHPLLEGEILKGIEFRWEPIELTNQGFEIVGTLSQLFTSYYAEQALNNGEVAQIRALPLPKWFDPLINANFERMGLPLWVFSLEPKSSETKG